MAVIARLVLWRVVCCVLVLLQFRYGGVAVAFQDRGVFFGGRGRRWGMICGFYMVDQVSGCFLYPFLPLYFFYFFALSLAFMVMEERVSECVLGSQTAFLHGMAEHCIA